MNFDFCFEERQRFCYISDNLSRKNSSIWSFGKSRKKNESKIVTVKKKATHSFLAPNYF